MAFFTVPVITEQRHNSGCDLKRFFRFDKYIEFLRQMRFCGESAAHHHMEPGSFLSVNDFDSRGIRQIVDLGLSIVIVIGGDRQLEFTRQVGEIPVQHKEIIQLLHDSGRIEQLVLVDSRQRITHDGPRTIPAGFIGIERGSLQSPENVREILNRQPVKLDSLPGGYINQPTPVQSGDLGNGSRLFRGHNSGIDADTHHEMAVSRLLLIDPAT